ncbi:unnamed protein product [Arctia plantaginis]|uniref:Regucalcin n=1 Tax=Arctia plantaginis TaxID=874455 RepID=A0A8S1B5L3_ARCPL|nr:unnamed protein product [Arctia plantaginis]
MSIKVQKITEPVVLGEGPHWDAQQQALYFVSILEHTIHKYVPATGQHTRTKLDGRVGFIIPVEGTSDQFLVGVERKFLIIKWDGGEGTPATVVKQISEVDQDVPMNRINDGKADPKGRVFAGTMGHEDPPGVFQQEQGSLYRINGSKVTKVVDKVGISNGLAWDLREKAMYYTDSVEKNIRRYDYDVETGEMSNMKFIFDFDKNNITGCPDGCTIDNEGNLWVAVFDGSCIINIDPRTGSLLRKVPIPALQVTSATFGGPNYDILFVTTASMNIQGTQHPPCGATFMVTVIRWSGYISRLSDYLMSVKVQKITEPVVLGEGPHWDDQQQALYFVSIREHTIHKYVPATGQHTRTKLDGRVGFIIPVEGTSDQFLVGVEHKFLIIKWDGGEGTPATVVKQISEVDQDVPMNRINDGKADPKGRVFAGTMGHEESPGVYKQQQGSLFRINGSKVTKVVDKVSISNGLAWDLREKAMYYTDSLEKNIRRYDYDVETGEMSNMKFIFDFVKNNITGFPDGCTIDNEGNLWVAVFDGSCIINIDPRTGTLLRKIPIPAPQVTSATFGGPNYDILFVTTVSMNFQGAQDQLCGATFMVTGLGVKGKPNVNYKL